METGLPTVALIAWLGFGLGAVFGFVGNKTNFCAMGAVSDIVHMGDWVRMRMWVLAIAVAMLGTWWLQINGLVDTRRSMYTVPDILWLSNLVGGLLFGAGMTLASGCTSKTLIRIGGGNLKSLVVFIVLAVSAYITMRGLFAVWRVETLDTVVVRVPATQDLSALLAGASGWSTAFVERWLPPLIAGGLLAFVLANRQGHSLDLWLGGVVIGLTIVGGWYVTGHVGFIAEDPNTLEEAFVGTRGNRPESLSLVAPFANTLELLMFWSDRSLHVSFGIAITVGIVAGSLLYALITRSWREESFPDASDLKRHLAGAVLMGFGGVTALGCTIGQGLTGVSTLAVGSFLSFFSIIAGAALTMKFQYWRLMRKES
mgnify:CR=1 FL=1